MTFLKLITILKLMKIHLKIIKEENLEEKPILHLILKMKSPNKIYQMPKIVM